MKEYKSFIKSILIVMISQALIYFFIKSFVSNFNIIDTIMNVPLIKIFIYFYDSWYPFIILCAFIVYKKDRNLYYLLVLSMMLSAFLAHITFIIFPTMVVRPDIEVNNLTDIVLYLTYKGDSPAVNCLPSVHCIYCFVTSYYIFKCQNLKFKTIIIIYSLIIVLSTLFTKQHIVEDVILSLIYTITSIFIINIFKEKLKIYTKFIFD